MLGYLEVVKDCVKDRVSNVLLLSPCWSQSTHLGRQVSYIYQGQVKGGHSGWCQSPCYSSKWFLGEFVLYHFHGLRWGWLALSFLNPLFSAFRRKVWHLPFFLWWGPYEIAVLSQRWQRAASQWLWPGFSVSTLKDPILSHQLFCMWAVLCK